MENLLDELIDCLRQRDNAFRNFRAPLSAGECDNPIPCFTSAGLNREGAHTLQDDRRALRIPLSKHLALPGHLGQKDEACMDLAVAIGEMADQKDPSLPVNFHFAVAEIWDLYADGTASGSFRDLVDNLLRKRVEDDRAGARRMLLLWVRPPVSTHNRVQSR